MQLEVFLEATALSGSMKIVDLVEWEELVDLLYAFY